MGSRPTFDEELLLWLGDEPEAERAADADRVREIAGEFALGFDRLAGIGPAATVFGSARTPPEHRHYALVRTVALADGRIESSDLAELQVVGDPNEVARIVVAAYERQRRAVAG